MNGRTGQWQWIGVAILTLVSMSTVAQAALLEAPTAEAVGKALVPADASWKTGPAGFGGPAAGEWTYALSRQASWADYRVQCRIKLVKPATGQGGIPRCAFAVYDAMAKLGGYEAAVIVRHESAGKHYRVMISSKWNEVVLWRPTGGVLQVATFKFETPGSYDVSVACQGRRITVAVDGKQLIDWWDRVDPVLKGQVGVGRKEGESYVTSLSVQALPKQTGTAPAHTPDFREVQWHNSRWFFDRNEPVCQLNNTNALDHMKFLPGYRGAFHALNHIKDWRRFSPEKIIDYKLVESGKRLVVDTVAIDAKTKAEITVATHLVVTFDPKTGMYVYDQTCTVSLPTDEAAKVAPSWDHGDPCFLGGVGSAVTRDPKAPRPFHHWSIFQGPDGKQYKIPLNHNGHYLGKGSTNGGPIKSDGGTWMLVGDPILTIVEQVLGHSDNYKEEVHVGHCWWAYDMHTQFSPKQIDKEIQPGIYTSKVRYTGASAAVGKRVLAQAELYKPFDAEAKVPLFRAGLGLVEKFDTIVTLATPHTEHKIWAGVIDKTVGHGDTFSLRLDGPTDAWTLTGGSYFMQNYQDRNVVSFYVKTKDVTGEGPTIGFARYDGKGDFYHTGITGTNDWTKVEFVAGEKVKYWGVYVIFRNAGSGTVWIDDFKIQPLTKDQTTDVPPGKTYPINAKDKDLVLSWGGKGSADTVLDESGYGHHGHLYGETAWVDDAGRKVLELGGKGHAWPLQTPNITLEPPYSMVFDIKPTAGGHLFAHGWGYYYYLQGAGPKFGIGYQPHGSKVISSKPFLDAGQWQRLVMVAADGKVKLYRDGQFVEALAGKLLPIQWKLHLASTWHRKVSLFGSGPGNMTLRYKREPFGCIKGRVAAVKFYDRALTEQEIAKLGAVRATP